MLTIYRVTLSGISITAHELWSVSYDMVLVSYTCEGAYRWHKVFGGGGTDVLSGVEVDSQDNVYVVGGFGQCSNPGPSNPYYSVSRISDNNGVYFTANTTQNSCQRAFRAKFNTAGVLQWFHYIQPATTSALATSGFIRNLYMVNDVLHGIAVLTPGTYEAGAINNTNTSVPFLFYLLKYDTSGTLLSATPFDFLLSGYTSTSLPRWYRNPYNGNYYVLQRQNTNSITMTAGGNTLNANIPKIVCFNDAGQYQWHRQPTGNQISFTSIDFDPGNNVYISGIANNFIVHSFLGWNLSGTNTGFSSFIMKCNPDITSYNWVTNHNPGGSGIGLLIYTPSTIYYAGNLNNNPYSWGTQSIAGPGPNNDADPLLARFDPATGACLSLQRIVGTNGYADGFTHIEQDAAGDLLLGGYMGLNLTDSNGIVYNYNGGNSDFFIAKYATQACQPLSNESFDKATIQVFPNPVQEQMQVNIKENTSYQLFTITGILVKQGNLTVTDNSLNVSDLSSGCYVLKLQTENGRIESVKVVKE